MKRTFLSKHDVLWIFAIKDNKIKEFYDLYYGEYPNQPDVSTMFAITSEIIDKLGTWNEVINTLRLNFISLSAIYGKSEMNLDEWLYAGIKHYLKFTTTVWLNENTNEDWKVWVEDTRKTYQFEPDHQRRKSYEKK